MNDERSRLEAQGWTGWLPQGPSRPVILQVTSVASLQSLGVKETQKELKELLQRCRRRQCQQQHHRVYSNRRLHSEVSQVSVATGHPYKL